jgi:hypothetical protein
MGKSKDQPAGGRVKSAGIAQRYGPIWLLRGINSGLALAGRPAVWSAITDLTSRHGRISDGSGILFQEKKIKRTARAEGNAQNELPMLP